MRTDSRYPYQQVFLSQSLSFDSGMLPGEIENGRLCQHLLCLAFCVPSISFFFQSLHFAIPGDISYRFALRCRTKFSSRRRQEFFSRKSVLVFAAFSVRGCRRRYTQFPKTSNFHRIMLSFAFYGSNVALSAPKFSTDMFASLCVRFCEKGLTSSSWV